MKKLLFALPLFFLLNNFAIATEKPTIGYVDLRKVLLESKVGKKNKAELEKMIKAKESTLAGEESKLQAMQEAFQKEMLLMTDEQKLAKQREFQEKAAAYQRKVNEAKQAVGKKDNEFTTKALADIKKIVGDLAKEMKLNLVLEANDSGLLYVEDGTDLTQKIIDKYDAKAK